MNVIVYAIASRSGGALSVLTDFYKEVTEHSEKYPDITWYFMLSTQELPETDNVKVIRNEWSVKSWGHRAYYNLVTVKRAIKKYNVKAIVSLQNMSVLGSGIPNIVCLHNVLPLYKCDATVLDNTKQRLKQVLVNRGIINSLRGAYRVMVASEWIKDELMKQFGIKEEQIVVSKLAIPKAEMPVIKNEEVRDGKLRFFYPASSFPYKNHRVVVEACKQLASDGVANYEVVFTIREEQSKTAAELSAEVKRFGLPIAFVGNLDRDLVLQAYMENVLLFPSKIENDAMPLLECMQYGGYVLAADLPYARDALGEYAGKKYFEANDALTLARQMRELIESGIPKVEIVPNGEMVIEKSRPEKVVVELRKLEME